METKSESKYERLRKIGIGSYGVVFKCVNRQTGQVVAIKRYSENDSDPIIRKIAMREVRMLRQLKHPNLINLIEVFRRKRRLHLVFDYCELTVLDVIEKYANNCPLNLIKKIIWQTVNGINYCHTHNCIHRDIKPENILINQAGVVKLCDFGFARTIIDNSTSNTLTPSKQYHKVPIKRGTDESKSIVDRQKENLISDRQALTEYVATRWYRAPELLIGDIHYSTKIDIWAIGCVTAELMRGEPIWPGKTDYDQLCLIINSIGQLTGAQAHTLLTQNVYDQASSERMLNLAANLKDSLERRLPSSRVGSDGVDFVVRCLQMDPDERPSSEKLLAHDYIHSVKMIQFIQGSSHLNSSTAPINLNDPGVRQTINIMSSNAQNHLQHQQQQQQHHQKSGGLKLNSQSLMLAVGGVSNLQSSPKHETRSPPQPSSKRLVVAAKVSSQNDTRTIRGSSIPVALSSPSASSGTNSNGTEHATLSGALMNASNRHKRRQQVAKTNLYTPDGRVVRSLVPVAERSLKASVAAMDNSNEQRATHSRRAHVRRSSQHPMNNKENSEVSPLRHLGDSSNRGAEVRSRSTSNRRQPAKPAPNLAVDLATPRRVAGELYGPQVMSVHKRISSYANQYQQPYDVNSSASSSLKSSHQYRSSSSTRPSSIAVSPVTSSGGIDQQRLWMDTSQVYPKGRTKTSLPGHQPAKKSGKKEGRQERTKE